MNEVPEVFPAYRLVAEFADGQRLTFDGLTTAIYAGMTA